MAGNDFCNGFNETARAAIFEGLYHSPFASLIPAAHQWYGERGALVLERRHGQLYVDGVCIDSDEGSRQGCGWGPLLFCVGGQRTLTLASGLIRMCSSWCTSTMCIASILTTRRRRGARWRRSGGSALSVIA